MFLGEEFVYRYFSNPERQRRVEQNDSVAFSVHFGLPQTLFKKMQTFDKDFQ